MSEFITHDISMESGEHFLFSQVFYGATSISYKVLKKDGEACFVKALRSELLSNNDYRTAFRKEYNTGIQLDCPYIVHYRDFEETENGELRIWMDYIEGETLEERLQNNPGYFAERENLDKMIHQLLLGLDYLHKHQVVHLDLKPSNIMLTQINNDVRLIDLGFCYTDSFPLNYGATYQYMAPETSAASDITGKADVYSFGQVLKTILNALKTKGLLTKKMERDYGKIASQCTVVSTDKRPSIQHLLEIGWASKHHKSWIYGGAGILIAGIIGIWLYFFYPHYDFYDNDVFYNILSEDSLTCEVTNYNGRNGACYDNNNIFIPNKVLHKGKEYRVIAIGDSAFKKSKVLSVQFSEGLQRIGNKAFYHCDSIVVFHVPESVTQLEPFCFAYCNGLEYIHLPGNIKKIPFRGICDALITDIKIPEGVTVLEQDALCGNRKLKKLTLPSTLERIDRGNFYYCESLEEITLPKNVKYIGDYMFYGCRSLKVINNLNPVPQEISPIFRKDCGSPVLRIPAGSEEAYAKANTWNTLRIETYQEPK